MTELRCRRCGTTNPADFFASRVAWGGSHRCKPCYTEYQRERYRGDAAYRERDRAYKRASMHASPARMEANRARAKAWRDRKRTEKAA